MGDQGLSALRQEIDRLNEEILSLLQGRAERILRIARIKQAQGLDPYDPQCELEMLQSLTATITGPLGPEGVKEIFKAIFHASRDLQETERHRSLRVRRRDLVPEGGIRVGNVAIGAGTPVLIAGPSSVETPEQMEAVASFLGRLPVATILRAGAFNPRTSPNAFQGLREEGLKLLREAADRHHLVTVTEVLDTSTLDLVASYTDMLQIGSSNMHNTELLEAVGRAGKPVLLNRGFMATIEELLLSAEYILSHGNDQIVLCERGVRTFEPSTHITLDISAVPLLKIGTSLPVIVDLSHAPGRRDIVLPCARLAMASGAEGLMVELHPQPDVALSDGSQQLDLPACASLVAALGWSPAKLHLVPAGRPRPFGRVQARSEHET